MAFISAEKMRKRNIIAKVLKKIPGVGLMNRLAKKHYTSMKNFENILKHTQPKVRVKPLILEVNYGKKPRGFLRKYKNLLQRPRPIQEKAKIAREIVKKNRNV